LNYLKTKLDDFGTTFFEKLGYFINPIILQLKNEDKQLLVFCFHGLFESLKEKKLNQIDPQGNMTVQEFIEFIDYFLDHNYKFIVPKDLITGVKNNQPCAMITFDDGYFNNLRAIEILIKYGIPAVFFISTKNVVENKAFWWDVIYKYRAKQGSSIEDIATEQKWLKQFNYRFINDYIFKTFGMEAFTPWSDINRPFNPDEIKQLSTNPYVSFGNHTHNHSILTKCTKEEIKEELDIANKFLFETTGTLPLAIAFPNGNFNQTVLEATEEEGFRYAFTTVPGRNLFPSENNKFTTLNRFMTTTMEISKFGAACRVGYQPHDLYNDLKKRTKKYLT
jgi:peptidoglycan/xylan/chitin deacetylase (PgdA/CDA1 family)